MEDSCLHIVNSLLEPFACHLLLRPWLYMLDKLLLGTSNGCLELSRWKCEFSVLEIYLYVLLLMGALRRERLLQAVHGMSQLVCERLAPFLHLFWGFAGVVHMGNGIMHII